MSVPKPKVTIDNEKLLKRMKRYEEVTGKQVAATLRRGARVLAVNLAYSTPPFGKNAAARKQGEIAVQNDLLRAYLPAAPINTLHPRTKGSFRDLVKRVMGGKGQWALRDAILAAIDGGNKIKNLRKSQKRVTKKSTATGIAALRELLPQSKYFKNYKVDASVDKSIHNRTRNSKGRVAKGWKSRTIVYNSKDLATFIRKEQNLVGLTKAAWASAALRVKADVQDALYDVPQWIKRHVSNVPSDVIDKADAKNPEVKLISKMPWADKALDKDHHKEAIRIGRQKFYNSMQKEIRACLKAEEVVPAIS